MMGSGSAYVWACIVTWISVFPVANMPQHSGAVVEVREKICYTKDRWKAVVEQRLLEERWEGTGESLQLKTVEISSWADASSYAWGRDDDKLRAPEYTQNCPDTEPTHCPEPKAKINPFGIRPQTGP